MAEAAAGSGKGTKEQSLYEKLSSQEKSYKQKPRLFESKASTLEAALADLCGSELFIEYNRHLAVEDLERLGWCTTERMEALRGDKAAFKALVDGILADEEAWLNAYNVDAGAIKKYTEEVYSVSSFIAGKGISQKPESRYFQRQDLYLVAKDRMTKGKSRITCNMYFRWSKINLGTPGAIDAFLKPFYHSLTGPHYGTYSSSVFKDESFRGLFGAQVHAIAAWWKWHKVNRADNQTDTEVHKLMMSQASHLLEMIPGYRRNVNPHMLVLELAMANRIRPACLYAYALEQGIEWYLERKPAATTPEEVADEPEGDIGGSCEAEEIELAVSFSQGAGKATRATCQLLHKEEPCIFYDEAWGAIPPRVPMCRTANGEDLTPKDYQDRAKTIAPPAQPAAPAAGPQPPPAKRQRLSLHPAPLPSGPGNTPPRAWEEGQGNKPRRAQDEWREEVVRRWKLWRSYTPGSKEKADMSAKVTTAIKGFVKEGGLIPPITKTSKINDTDRAEALYKERKARREAEEAA